MKKILTIFIILFSIISCKKDEPPNFIFRDDFNDSTLNSLWSWTRENTSSWSLTGNSLKIELDYGDLWSDWTNNCKNLLLTDAPVSDNYTIESRLSASLTANINQAHILLYGDDDNYIRYGLVNCFNCGGVRVTHVHELNAAKETQNWSNYSEADVYLRIEKTDNKALLLYSADGINWSTHEEIALLNFTVNKVGLVAFDGSEPPSSSVVEYDYFEIREN